MKEYDGANCLYLFLSADAPGDTDVCLCVGDGDVPSYTSAIIIISIFTFYPR